MFSNDEAAKAPVINSRMNRSRTASANRTDNPPIMMPAILMPLFIGFFSPIIPVMMAGMPVKILMPVSERIPSTSEAIARLLASGCFGSVMTSVYALIC